MNVVTNTKEKDKLDRPVNRRGLALVEPLGKRHRKAAFRIGVSDDLFSPRRRAGDGPRNILGGGSDKHHNGEGQPEQRKDVARSETLIAFAVAGLILGYFIGRLASNSADD